MSVETLRNGDDAREMDRPELALVTWKTVVVVDVGVPQFAGGGELDVELSPFEAKLARELPIFGGLQSVKERLVDICRLFLRCNDEQETHHVTLEAPRGILMYGPPGTGKSSLARWMAARFSLPLFVINGNEVASPYAGVAEQTLRDVFAKAAAAPTPCLLLLDEVDALCPSRERAAQQTVRIVAQLLTLLDGAGAERRRVLVVGTTNRPHALDSAVRRAGRLEVELNIAAPNEAERADILRVLLRKVPLRDAVCLEEIARKAVGYVGADLVALVREACSRALNASCSAVGMDAFEAAMSAVLPSLARSVQLRLDASVGWSSVGGYDHVKQSLRECVEWPLRHAATFERMGIGGVARGVLLYGPPGCSKTTLAKAVANVSGLFFVALDCAAIYSPYVGDAEATIREAFARARHASPAILFLDELDTIVTNRGAQHGGGGGGGGGGGVHAVQHRVLAALLAEMDGLESSHRVAVIGATNRRDTLDDALLRPGRFDRLLYVGAPDHAARLDILRVHCRSTPLHDDVNLDELALRTDGYSGADLACVVREAAMCALRDSKEATCVRHAHLLEASASVRPSLGTSLVHTIE